MDEDTLNQFLAIGRILWNKIYSIQMPQAVILDLDSTLLDAYGRQEGRAFNFHYQSNGYHPLVCYDGMARELIKFQLRDGTQYSCTGVADFLQPILDEYLNDYLQIRILLRGDGGFATLDLYKQSEVSEDIIQLQVLKTRILCRKNYLLIVTVCYNNSIKIVTLRENHMAPKAKGKHIKISTINLIYIVAEIIILIIVFFLDLFGAFAKIEQWLWSLTEAFENTSCFKKFVVIKMLLLLCIKHVLLCRQEDSLNILLTFGTILAAAVIFFYSMQDNKKEGIPNRLVLSYTSGMLTVHVLFFSMMFMIPMNYFASFFGLNYFAWIEMLFTYITQVMILWIVLKATSRSYSIHAICNAEIRQYQSLIKIETERFSYTYLFQHLEQVLSSDEINTDNLQIAGRLLRVPYYENKISAWADPILPIEAFLRKVKKVVNKNPELSEIRLRDNNLKIIYGFYYRNLITVFRKKSQQLYKEEREKIYLILYDFLEELMKLYEISTRICDKEDKTSFGIYTMTVCAILNAVMESDSPEADGFCNYVFNNFVCKETLDFQIFLYLLFQEFLLWTNTEAVKLDNFKNICCIDHLNIDKILNEEQKIGYTFWNIWSQVGILTCLDQKENIRYQKFVWTMSTSRDVYSLINQMNIRLEKLRAKRRKKEDSLFTST